MLHARPPRHPALASVVRTLWYAEGQARRPGARERVLPTGAVHLAFRLASEPLRLFADERDEVGRSVGHALVGGPRTAAYVRDVSHPVPSVGAQLLPGAVPRLFDVPAWELAERHVELEDLWRRAASLARERIAAGRTPGEKLDALEALLVERASEAAVHPAVAHAVRRLDAGADIRTIVRECGYSHRHFVALFHRTVGLAPKVYGRVLRFQRALALRREGGAWADVAFAAGYSDQAHFSREFRALAGMTPGRYGVVDPESPNHVPIA